MSAILSLVMKQEILDVDQGAGPCVANKQVSSEVIKDKNKSILCNIVLFNWIGNNVFNAHLISTQVVCS